MIDIYKFEEKWLTSKKEKDYGETTIRDYFINPSSKELKQCGDWTKGIIYSKTGDLYVGGPSDDTFHIKILQIMPFSKSVLDDLQNDEIDQLVFLNRKKDTNEFYLAIDRYPYDFPNYKEEEELEKVFAKAKKKNSSLKFKMERI